MSSSQSSRASEAQLDSSIQQSYAHILKRINTTNFNNTINEAGNGASDDFDVKWIYKNSNITELTNRLKQAVAVLIREVATEQPTAAKKCRWYTYADTYDFVGKMLGLDLKGGWQDGLDKILEENYQDAEVGSWISRRQSEASVRTA